MRSGALAGRSTMQPRSDNKRAKNLRALLAGSSASVPAEVAIVDLTLDSRNVQPGGAFVALPGTRTHGIGFATQAVSAGARVDPVGTDSRRCGTARSRQRTAARCPQSHCNPRHDRRPLLRRAVADRASGGRHRHERQDDDRARDRDGVAAARHRGCVRGHDRLRPHRRAEASDAHHAGLHHRPSPARRPARRRRALSCDGGLVARARPASRGRRAVRYRGVHQPDTRSSGLSRQLRELCRREGRSCSRGRI